MNTSSSSAEPPGRRSSQEALARITPSPLADASAASAPSAPSIPSAPSVAGVSRSAELEVRGISKSFGDVQVLRDISITVRHGEFVTLLGPSGCGKTTLLRILAGLEVADRGDVVLLGRNISRLPANRRPVNTVFQNYALFPHLSVFENVAFGLRARKIPSGDIKRRVHESLEMLQLTDLLRRHPHQLSGGQRQRVALARALVNQPDLLLLDEPMSALDAKLRAEVQIEIRRLQRQLGKTFILVTHDQDEAMTVSDRILVMNDGSIIQAGTPADVYEHPINRFVAQFLGSANLIAARREGELLQTDLGPLRIDRQTVWDRGTLAIRPERIHLASQRPPSNGVEAEIREIIYRGDHYELFLTPGPLRVKVSPVQQLKVGQSVWLHLPQEHLEVLAD